MGRILLVTFQQALRSVALTVLPLSFIALFAWSTAGSATGNTSDPIRAALWIWLATHLIPFKLSLASGFSSGALTYLPLGAVIFPWLAIRNGFRRASEFLGNPRGARSLLVFWYVAIASAAALFSQSPNIKANLILTPIFVFLISLSATFEYNNLQFARLKFLGNSAVALLGLALIVLGASLILHFNIVKSLAIVIQPGIVGGILFSIIQLLYLPNLAIATLSYIFGAGFTIGIGTQVSPTTFNLNSLPAIPILGALPTSTRPLLQISLLIPILILSLNQIVIFKSFQDFKVRQSEVIKTLAPALIIIFLISYFAGGTLLTQDMDPVGVIWWKLPALFAAISATLLVIGLYIPKLIKVARALKSEL
jgi:hypothetical protein